MRQQKLDIDQKRGGFYWLDGKPYVSVTTVLGETLRKPGLEWWMRERVYWAVAKDPSIEKAKALAAPDIAADQAKDRGSTVHSILESYKTTGRQIESVPEKFAGYARAIYSFLQDHNFQIKEQEKTVVSKEHGFAGTADLFLIGNDKVFLVDAKTGKRLYDEVFLQLSGYKLASLEMRLQVDEIGALLLRENGQYEFSLGEARPNVFLAVLAVWKWRNRELLKQLEGGEM